MTIKEPLVQRYLDEFRVGLKGIPEAERNDLVLEIESHIAEAMNSGRSLTEVLERLGPADRLARAYAAEAILGNGKRGLQWLRAAGVLLSAGASSIVVIPILGPIAIFFPLGGVVGLVGNPIYYWLYPAQWLPHTSIPWIVTPLANVIAGTVACVLLILMGVGAYRLLMWYIRFTIRNLRQALN
ncbi:MAG: DUF1700 domain-containing protein [Mycobacterium leprae]